jgi:hypothetical protein
MKILLCSVAAALAMGACAGTRSAKAPPRPEAQPAQAAGSQPPGRRDAQAAIEPRSGPGEGQKLLARFAGEWDVVRTFYPRSGEPTVVRGTCVQKMVQEGRFLESDFVFEAPEGRTTGMGITGFDPQTGRFTSFWIDSRSTRFSVRQSRDPFDGEHVVLHSASLGEPGPNERQSWTTAALEDGGRRLVHRQYGLGPDGKERLVMQLEMTRK